MCSACANVRHFCHVYHPSGSVPGTLLAVLAAFQLVVKAGTASGQTGQLRQYAQAINQHRVCRASN
jgi:hypothetical protein